MNLRKSLTFCIVFIPILSVLSSCSLFLVATDDMSDKELQACGAQAKIKANRKSCLDSYINRKSIKEPATKTDTDSYVMTNQSRHHFNIENNEIYIYYTDKEKAYGWIKKKLHMVLKLLNSFYHARVKIS
ncbi:hypothetical protein CQW45_001903 [Salmonella enterica subsp. enterica serovar Braenderup str. CFSAN001755]|nr:hypothetical protein [Salmonella enterica subsp. enterica serovar Braenderup]